MEAADGHCEYKETTCISLYTLLQQPYSLITEDNQLCAFFILLLRRLLQTIKVWLHYAALFNIYYIFNNLNKFMHSIIFNHLPRSARLLVSSSLLGEARKASTRCWAENRTWACLTANRRTTNWATPHPNWATPHPNWAMPHPNWTTPHPNWATPQPNWATLYLTELRRAQTKLRHS